MAQSDSATGSSTGGRIFRVLTVTVSVVLLVLVGRALPWRDRVVWQVGELEQVIPGKIEGDWQQAEIRFRAAEEFQPDSADFARAAPLAEGMEARITRERLRAGAVELEGSFDWRPGMPRIFAGLDATSVLTALAFIVLAQILVITRWWRLLCRLGCPMSFLQTLRLGLIGMFFNSVVPGAAGGDLVKTLIVVRENPGRRAEALASVVLDRFMGVVVLVALAAVMVLFLGDDFASLRAPILLFLLGCLIFPAVYASKNLRRWIGFDRLRRRFPKLERIDEFDRALMILREHPLELALVLLMTLANHLAFVFAIMTLGRAFGDELSVQTYMVVVPVANIVSALPVAAGGWGLGEAAYGILFGMVGGNASIGAAASATSRLCLTLLGMLGGLFLLHPGLRRSWRASQRDEEAEVAPALPEGEA
jgi:uncharacterized protein (TIRG00374 family)